MKILSIDGGGYLGLASASFLAETERHFEVTCHESFDLFCGTSTGAIIALALASGKTALEVVEMYKSFGPKVFHNPFPRIKKLRWIRGIFTSLYGNTGLKNALKSAFNDMTLGSIYEKGKFVMIPAFCLTTGKPRVFKTDHAPNLSLHNGYRIRDVALASSAAPVYLPIVEIPFPTDGRMERFCDGGIFANHPAILGLSEALSCLNVPPQNISLLSISTPRANLAEELSNANFIRKLILSRGIFMWSFQISRLFIDSTSEISNEVLQRMFRAAGCSENKLQRIVFNKPYGVEMDLATSDATHTLETLGTTKASISDIRNQMKMFFLKNDN